jgi:hypothetical protein
LRRHFRLAGRGRRANLGGGGRFELAVPELFAQFERAAFLGVDDPDVAFEVCDGERFFAGEGGAAFDPEHGLLRFGGAGPLLHVAAAAEHPKVVGPLFPAHRFVGAEQDRLRRVDLGQLDLRRLGCVRGRRIERDRHGSDEREPKRTEGRPSRAASRTARRSESLERAWLVGWVQRGDPWSAAHGRGRGVRDGRRKTK